MTSTLLLVLGMHRSGTSCLTGLLGESGVWLGPVEKGSPHNRKGNNENRRVMNVNKAVLRDCDTSWHEPPVNDAPWLDEHLTTADEILLDILAPGRTTAMKDPRSLYTGHGWVERAALVGAEIRRIGTFRHPAAVISSLQARDPEFPSAKAADLWKRYNRRLLVVNDETPFPIVNFDLDPDAYLIAVRAAFDQLGLATPDAFEFFDAGLRTNDGDPMDDESSEIYAELARRAIAG
ncbi:MAG: hypothetical protein AAF548_00790 [Actinomycetota bacterium]